MKIRNIIFMFFSLFIAISLIAQEGGKRPLPQVEKRKLPLEEKKVVKKQETPALQGTVVSFNDFVMKGNTTLTKEEAMKYVENGEALAFLVGDKVYFVYDKKGAIQSQKLAELAGKPVAIAGEEQTKHGVMILVAKSIKPVE